MHKIKEMLHKDSEDSNQNVQRDNHGELNQGNFQHNHVHHAERYEHGGDQHLHQQHLHQGGHLGGEKHTYYEREAGQGGNLYREGVDPTLNRHIHTQTSHDAGVTRSIVGEGEVIKEKIKEVELHKVQPVVHRDREQMEIRHVVQPHQQFEVRDTQIAHREKDIDLGTRREASSLQTTRAIGGAPQMQSSREFIGTERQHQELPARLEEHVHRNVEEHVHPVIYKETLAPKVTEEVHHLYERVQERPIETYEVRNTLVHGDGTRSAEREFFQREGSRGIGVDQSRSLNVHNTCSGCNNNLGDNSMMTGHHQNIGAHHLPASTVQGGHNSAYDAALCNQCTGNQICSHSERDASLMQKMNEKKIVQEEKLLRKSGGNSSMTHNTVV